MAVIGQLSTVWNMSAIDKKTKMAISRKGLQIQAKERPKMLRKTSFLITSKR
jgi:hypothetical protein